MILSENDLSDPLMGNPSAPLSAPPEYPYLDDHPCKIKKNPLFDISDFNCINHDPEHGCAGLYRLYPYITILFKQLTLLVTF